MHIQSANPALYARSHMAHRNSVHVLHGAHAAVVHNVFTIWELQLGTLLMGEWLASLGLHCRVVRLLLQIPKLLCHKDLPFHSLSVLVIRFAY